MEIQDLTSQNEEAVCELVAAIHSARGLTAAFYWPPEMLRAELRIARGRGLFLENTLVSVILYRALEGAWDISLVASQPQFQRQGHTVKLLESLMCDALRHKMELWLEVHQDNFAAQKLYEKLGFKEVGRRPRYYKDGATAILYSYP